MINFKSIPFFKILFSYCIGIFCAISFKDIINSTLFFLFSFILVIVVYTLQKLYANKQVAPKTIFIFSVHLFLFSLAFETCYLYNDKNNSEHYSHYLGFKPQSFIVTIDDIPIVSKKTTKLSVELNSIELNNNWHYCKGKSIIYIKKDTSLNLNIGNKLLIKTQFNYIPEPKNLHEFNYKKYLEEKNIFHTAFTDKNNVTVLANNEVFSYSKIGTFIKSELISKLRDSKLSAIAFSICSALLVGYDDEIDEEVMKSFSHSGTLHILSVSGLHTGVLYTVLIFIFSLFDKYDKYKKIKFIFIMFGLWLFVFITGLSPSILRATLMLTLIFIGKEFYKQGNSYNTLFLSAFILLLFNPFLIKDIGFLLSYCAVFGIMYLYPKIQKLYYFNNNILQAAWSSVLISISATIFTLPISLFFFHQFPIWFMLSNLIIIPISFIIMAAAILLLMFYKITFLKYVVIVIINFSTSVMLWFAKLTDNPNFGYIDFIPFSIFDLCLMVLIISLCLSVIFTKSYSKIIALSLILIIWLSSSIIYNYIDSKKKELVVFHVKHQSVFLLRVGHNVYANFNSINTKDFERHVKPYLLNISNLKMINTSSNAFKLDNTLFLKNYLQCNIKKLNPNFVLVSNNIPVNLSTNYKCKPLIIADCSNSYKFVKELKKQCSLLEIPFYSVNENGAFSVNL